MGTKNFSPQMKAFYDFWLSLPRESGQIVPARRSLNPVDFKPLLPFFFLSEWKSETEIINKITGTKLDEKLGSNLTGFNVLKNYTKNKLEFYQHYWSTIKDQPCGAFLIRNVMFPNGKVFQMHDIHLPLNNKKGETVYFCGINESKEGFHSEDEKRLFELLNKSQIVKMELFDIGAGLPKIQPDINCFNKN